jgi:outer membrane protein, heavy metal efflux system
MSRWTYAALVCAVLWCAPAAFAGDVAPSTGVKPITLKEAIARALDASAAVKAREERVGGAEAGVRQSGVLPNPEIDVELENFAGSGPFKDLDDSELTLGVSQRIERGGKRDGRVAVAQFDRDIAAIERDTARLDAAAEARRAFYEVSAGTALVKVRKAGLDSAREIEAMAIRRVRSARDPVTVKLRAEIQTAEAKGAYDRAVLALETAKRKLASLWGDPAATFSVDDAALFVVPEGDATAPSGASPDIKIKEATARRAAAKVELENANARSDVSVGLGVRRFENGGDLAGVLSLSVPLAIFDVNQGNIDQAAAERRAADLEVIEAQRVAEREALSLRNDVTSARAEALAIRSELLPRAEEALRAARRGYDLGAFSYLELSESQRTLNEIRAREVEVLRDLQFALAALDRLASRDISINEGPTP